MVISSSTKLNYHRLNQTYSIIIIKDKGRFKEVEETVIIFNQAFSRTPLDLHTIRYFRVRKKKERRELSNIKTEQKLELPNCLLDYELVVTNCVICFYKNRICKISITMKEKLQLQSFRIVYRWQVDIFEILESPFITIYDLYQKTLIIFLQLIQQTITENWLTRSPHLPRKYFITLHGIKPKAMSFFCITRSNPTSCFSIRVLRVIKDLSSWGHTFVKLLFSFQCSSVLIKICFQLLMLTLHKINKVKGNYVNFIGN